MRKKMIYSIAINCLIVFLVMLAFVQMMIRNSGAALTSSGFSNLKYFTTLSNIFAGIVSALYAINLFRVASGKTELSHRLYILKLVSASSVCVTFLVVVLFLGPVFGFSTMYRGSNLWYHLVVPLLCMADFIVFERYDSISFQETLWCMIPTIIYGSVYLGNILINGAGEWPNRNDFYGFVLWGLPIGIAIFAGIVLLGWVSGILLRLGNKAKKSDKIS